MITLMEFVNATAWLRPQDHMQIVLWNKSKVYEKDEFENIEFNIRNFAKYGNYWVDDIDIVERNGKVLLCCSIWKD